MNRTGIWKRVLPALVVGIGIAVVWGLVVGWGASLVEQYSRPPVGSYENVVVTRHGTPLIQTQSALDYYAATYRTLDGRPVSVQGDAWREAADLDAPPRPPGLFYWPIAWRNRLMSTSNYGRPPVGWYLIRDAQPHGHAYFVGYDVLSKLRVGYIGRQGFRPSLPPREDWFDLGTRQLAWSRGICSTGFLQFGRANYYQGSGEEDMPEWLMFLIDGDRLQQVDLQARTVRTLYRSPGLTSVGIVHELLGTPPADTAAATTLALADTKTASRLALRTVDRIVILDPLTGERREYTLPESVRSESVSAYAIGARQLLLVRSDWPRALAHLWWLDPDGTVSRHETVALTGYRVISRRLSSALAAVVVPVPAGWVLVEGVAMPLDQIQENYESTYLAALRSALDQFWPGLVGVWVVGGVLAWLVARLQRKYYRSHTGIWAVFVLLFGPAALAAYWVEHRRPKLEPCGQCGRVVPRDRDACAACGALFPAPPTLGTEIFA